MNFLKYLFFFLLLSNFVNAKSFYINKNVKIDSQTEVLNSSKKVTAKAQKGIAEIFLFYKLNTTELKLGTALNGTFKPENWIDIGNKLEIIEDCAYLGKDGNIVTGSLEIVEKEGAVGLRAVEEVNKGKYSFAFLKTESGFVDLLPNLLKEEGLTLDDFHYMMQKNINALTNVEKIKLTNIRNALPKPDANTIMQKVIPKTDIEGFITQSNDYYKQVGGYASRATDAKHLKTFEDLYYGERLDYKNTKFFLSANGCGEIRFKSIKSSEAVIPTGDYYNGFDYPFTAQGFTSGNNGRIGIPELHFKNKIDFSEGDEIWEIFHDGSEKLRAVYDETLKKFIRK